MPEYTAEDFANARFAEHADGRIAMRAEPETGIPWHVGVDQFKGVDGEMAENGWRPVVEADHPVRPLAGYRAQVRELREDNEALRGRVEGLMHQLSAGERTVAALRALTPLTLDTLREAWESAEVLTKDNPIREGDELIEKSNDHDFGLFEATQSLAGASVGVGVRILRRAPRREPWQALADVLSTNSGELIGEHHSITEVAKALHARGVRVTGGEEA